MAIHPDQQQEIDRLRQHNRVLEDELSKARHAKNLAEDKLHNEAIKNGRELRKLKESHDEAKDKLSEEVKKLNKKLTQEDPKQRYETYRHLKNIPQPPKLEKPIKAQDLTLPEKETTSPINYLANTALVGGALALAVFFPLGGLAAGAAAGAGIIASLTLPLANRLLSGNPKHEKHPLHKLEKFQENQDNQKNYETDLFVTPKLTHNVIPTILAGAAATGATIATGGLAPAAIAIAAGATFLVTSSLSAMRNIPHRQNTISKLNKYEAIEQANEKALNTYSNRLERLRIEEKVDFKLAKNPDGSHSLEARESTNKSERPFTSYIIKNEDIVNDLAAKGFGR